jgi:hypothetical protein
MHSLTCITTTSPAAPQLTEAMFCAWLGAAVAGDAIIYHRGTLARDTCPQMNLRSLDERVRVARLSSRALKLAEAGLLHLVQRRHGFEDFAYIAIARPKPRRNAPALHALLVKEAA